MDGLKRESFQIILKGMYQTLQQEYALHAEQTMHCQPALYKYSTARLHVKDPTQNLSQPHP